MKSAKIAQVVYVSVAYRTETYRQRWLASTERTFPSMTTMWLGRVVISEGTPNLLP